MPGRRGRQGLFLASVLGFGGMVFFLAGCPVQEVGKLDEVPTVVVVDHQTGERSEMPIEQYVKGVVAGEMKPGWPENAYAAQAILARSFAMEFLNRSEGNEISTDPEVAQAYQPQNITDVIDRAVEKTRGEVMTYRGRLVRAWFHAYAGGQTATAKEGLAFEEEEPPYIKPVKLPENEFADPEVKGWRAAFTLDQVRARLAEAGVDVGAIQSIQAVEKGPSGRITQVRITGSGGSETMAGADFRVALGAEEMKSTLVGRFDVEGGRLIVEGTGFGHGVGLSQWDAFMFARQGKSPEDIVRFFFRGIRIFKMWD